MLFTLRFIYMYVAFPFSIQFMDRLKLLLMPLKHQPDFIYLRHVPLRRVHLFTFLQVVCLALLWILKSTVAAIIFPVMVGDVLCLFQPHLCSVAWAFHTWAYSPMNTQIKSSNCKSPTSELHTPIIVLM